jgi:signal transduction histidine kinase
MVLHELSQPLTTLHGILELELREQEKRGQPEVAVQQALEQADQAIRVYRAMRDLVAIETEPPESRSNEPPGNLDQALREVTAELAPLARSRSVLLGLGSLAGPAKTRLPAPRLWMTMHKLLESLIEASPPEARVTAALGLRHDRICAVFSVAPGLEQAAASLAQAIPARSRGANSREVDWGFLLARRIVEKAGGMVSFEPNQLQATELVVDLPRAG